jgi:hypothetical protein
MEVQEFAPRHLIAQLAFKRRQASVVDRRGELADELARFLDASSVSLAETAAEAATDDGLGKYRIGIAQILVARSIDGLEDGGKGVGDFFQRGMELLGAPELRRVVAHTSDVAAVPSFEEMRDALGALTPGMPRLREAVGVPVADLAWAYDFSDDRWVVEVRIGPMHDTELRDAFDAPEGLDLPPASLLLDVKVVLRVQDGAGDAVQLWSSALERNRKITDNVNAWLREALA